MSAPSPTVNPLGVHALVWAAGWSPEEAEHACAATAAIGFDLLEIPLLDPSAVDGAATAEALTRHGLSATCSLGLATDTDISSEDTSVVAAGERLLHSALDVTTAVGSPLLCGVIYSAMTKYIAPPTPQGRANSATVLRDLAKSAATHGVTLGLEAVNRYETNLVNTVADALRLVDAIGEDNVTVHLDAYHANIEEGDIARPVRQAGDRLGYVHVGESHRGYLGSGTIDWPSFFRALMDSAYTGPITFESFSSAVVSDAFAAALGVWRDLWHDGRDLAAHARRFIDDQLHAARRLQAGA
jgi:D-psicose/D-tagatose/L-ribulose 3-epimerase